MCFDISAGVFFSSVINRGGGGEVGGKSHKMRAVRLCRDLIFDQDCAHLERVFICNAAHNIGSIYRKKKCFIYISFHPLREANHVRRIR